MSKWLPCSRSVARHTVVMSYRLVHQRSMGETKLSFASMTQGTHRRWSALALIVTAQFMVILDVAFVNIALPSIKTDLGFSQSGLQWVISAYAIIFGGALLLGGRLADLLGRRRMFIAGLALFAV